MKGGNLAETSHHQRTFIVLFIAIFVAMLGVGVIAPTMPIYAKTLGASGFWLGIIYASFSFSRLIFMPIAGRLSDTRGRKAFIILGLSIYSLASVGYIWANSILQITWIRLLHGIGSAMVIPIATAVIGDISPAGKEGRMMGNFQIALFLGFGAGPLLGGMVMQTWSINEVFYVMGGMSLFSLIVIARFLPESIEQTENRNADQNWKLIWHACQFRGIFLFRFANAVGRAAILSFLPVFADQLKISPAQIGFLVSLNIFITALLQRFTGKMADRLSRSVLITLGNTIAALSIICLPFAHSFTHFIIFGTIMGIGCAIAFPAAGAVATTLGREHGMGNVMGQFNMAMSLGGITGALMAGWIMDLFGMNYVFIVCGAIGLLGSICCWGQMGKKA
ncbi:MFS transporter [bacterium]